MSWRAAGSSCHECLSIRNTPSTGEGEKTLGDLFGGRSQLLVYHFMFGPKWAEGCPGCSLQADSFDRTIVHLNNRDVTMVCASRAPLAQLDADQLAAGVAVGRTILSPGAMHTTCWILTTFMVGRAGCGEVAHPPATGAQSAWPRAFGRGLLQPSGRRLA